MLTLIVAVDRNRAIGRGGDLPWRQSSDLKHFKQKTMDSVVVMGRTTFESIGKPLPGRRNIVLTRNSDWEHDGVEIMSFQEILKLGEFEDIFVIGGGQIYELFLPYVQYIELTIIDTEVDGADTWFPGIDEFTEVDRIVCSAGENDDFDMIFTRLERRN